MSHLDPTDIRSAVMQTIGAASMCWTETPGGVFDAEQAIAIGDRLISFIERGEW
mgnify:CR=1 FL=1